MNNISVRMRGLHENIKIVWAYALFWVLCPMIYFISSNENWVMVFVMSLFTCVLALIAWVDYKEKIIPNELIVFAIGLRGLYYLLMVFTPFYFEPAWIIGDLLVGMASGLLLMVGKVFKAEVGWGDIKLLMVMGLYLGVTHTFSMLFYSVLTSFVFTVGALIAKRLTLKDSIPFAPFVFMGYIMAMIFA